MPTKTSSKGGSGKKSPTAGKSASKKPAAAKKTAPPPPREVDDEDVEVAAPTPAPVAAAPAKAPTRSRYGKVEQEAPPIIPARRLTPEAKARVNEMVAKGIPLGEALRSAAAWETFVAPVREEPPKLVQGQGDGPKPPRDVEHEEEAEEADEEEPVVADSDE